MRHYILRFVGAHILAVALSLGMLAIAFANWFMSTSPKWFDLLCYVVAVLPYLILGEFAGRRWGGALTKRDTRRGLLILLGGMGLVGIALLFMEQVPALIYLGFLHFPAMIVPAYLIELCKLEHICGYQVYLHLVKPAGNLLGCLALPLLFHLGWIWGRREKIVDIAS